MDGVPVRIEQDTQNGQPARCRLSTFMKPGFEMAVTPHSSNEDVIIRSETGKGITVTFVTSGPLTVGLPEQKNFSPEVAARREYSEALSEIRARVFEALDQHEKGPEHSGQPCWSERCNLIAFLCHSLGLNLDHFSIIAEVLEGYGHDHNKREDDAVLDPQEVISDE